MKSAFHTACRMAGVKRAADAAGRKLCFMGLSLHSYLEAAQKDGRAPFDPDDIVPMSAVGDMDPNELLIITTGSQVRHRVAGLRRLPARVCFVAEGLLCMPFVSMSLSWSALLCQRLAIECLALVCHVHLTELARFFPISVRPRLMLLSNHTDVCAQAEPRAQLALAAKQSSPNLKLDKSDLLLYAARIIPGNSTRVTQMMNDIAAQGPEIAMGRSDLLHTSGHAYR